MQQIRAFLNRSRFELLTSSGFVSILCHTFQGCRNEQYGCAVQRSGQFLSGNRRKASHSPVEDDGQAAPPEPQQALGLYREEAYKDNGGHQQITEKFEN